MQIAFTRQPTKGVIAALVIISAVSTDWSNLTIRGFYAPTNGEKRREGGLMIEGFTRANIFELFGDSIQVSYSSTNILGGPLLSYRDSQRSLSFRGAEIRSQETELGELITVTLEAIPDLRTMTFTLILPIVTVMPQSSGTYIRAPGVTTTNPTTIAGPPPGPQKLYAVVNLQGTAQLIVS